MGIFNTEITDLRIGEIYDLDSACPIAYTFLPDNNWLRYGKIYELELCQVTNWEYQLQDGMSIKEFSDGCLNAFKGCPISGLKPMSDWVEEHCGIPGDIRVDIIHDIYETCRHPFYMSYFHKNNPFLHTRLAVDFPSPYPYDRRPGHLSHNWGMIYRYNEQEPTIHLILFPLIPKEGCIDVFKSN